MFSGMTHLALSIGEVDFSIESVKLVGLHLQNIGIFCKRCKSIRSQHTEQSFTTGSTFDPVFFFQQGL